MALVKAIHISALLVWCAGLVYMPGLLLGHRHASDPLEFARVRRASRFAYAAVTSPAAFVAVGSGTALLFLTDAMHGWMFAKLAVVGLLVGVHVHYGYVLGRLAEEGREPPRRRLAALFASQFAIMGGILFLVLAEPPVPVGWLPAWVTTPGGLQSALSSITPI